jgi:hypothetical protein
MRFGLTAFVESDEGKCIAPHSASVVLQFAESLPIHRKCSPADLSRASLSVADIQKSERNTAMKMTSTLKTTLKEV